MGLITLIKLLVCHKQRYNAFRIRGFCLHVSFWPGSLKTVSELFMQKRSLDLMPSQWRLSTDEAVRRRPYPSSMRGTGLESGDPGSWPLPGLGSCSPYSWVKTVIRLTSCRGGILRAQCMGVNTDPHVFSNIVIHFSKHTLTWTPPSALLYTNTDVCLWADMPDV